MSDSRSSEAPAQTSKVKRVIEEYDLTDMGRELEEYWLGEESRRYSLRELAEHLNRRILRSAMVDAGMSTMDGEVENVHRLLTNDDVSEGVRTQARKNLEREGVDPERLERDFVSHQAIHTYLTKYRGVSHEATSDEDQMEKYTGTIQRLGSRTTAVTETTLDRLDETGRITLGDFDVLVDVRVFCRDCGSAYPVEELVENGGCECGS